MPTDQYTKTDVDNAKYGINLVQNLKGPDDTLSVFYDVVYITHFVLTRTPMRSRCRSDVQGSRPIANNTYKSLTN